jgi:hypothetical protein
MDHAGKLFVMKTSICLFALVGWGLISVQGQNVELTPAQTNMPPLALDPAVMLRAPLRHQSSQIVSPKLQEGGLMVKLATKENALQAINPWAPLAVPNDYLDTSLDPMPAEHRGLVLFWMSF